MSLAALLQERRDLWRGGQDVAGMPAGIPSGYAQLDALLPGGGWPRAALTELLVDTAGQGELELLMPALARVSREQRWIALVAPPWIPYAPGLAGHGVRLERLVWIRPGTDKDSLWSLEQALRGGACSAVLGWPQRLETGRLRRLQLAAERGDSSGFLFFSTAMAAQASPA
ncbi:MAG: translesion DNA synthesis-associated protein ImuA, partial [Pseudomonadota bacterium]